jgi:glycosyltransferase involved in cell wall biosynthesis
VFTIAFVGRLIELKGVELLIEAFALADLPASSELVVLGDGPIQDKLRQLADESGLAHRVRFLGFREQHELPSILCECDALVLPSLRECGGAVVLEAMALALPVIATRWGGPADYLDSTCGILVDPLPRPDFVVALASAIRTLASDPARRRKMGAAGQAKVERLFDWERKVDRMIEIYRWVQSAGPSPGTAEPRDAG